MTVSDVRRRVRETFFCDKRSIEKRERDERGGETKERGGSGDEIAMKGVQDL